MQIIFSFPAVFCYQFLFYFHHTLRDFSVLFVCFKFYPTTYKGGRKGWGGKGGEILREQEENNESTGKINKCIIICVVLSHLS